MKSVFCKLCHAAFVTFIFSKKSVLWCSENIPVCYKINIFGKARIFGIFVEQIVIKNMVVHNLLYIFTGRVKYNFSV